MKSTQWTRRSFGQAALALAGSSLVARPGFAAASTVPGLAIVGTAPSGEPAEGAIHLFRIAGERWTPLGSLPAAAPAHLLHHPTLPVLYAVHAVDTWDHLPRGAVSAYHLDRQSGRLALLGTQPLSLSATAPRHAVLTAGATHLFVAAEGGGIYNLLPVASDGTLLPVSDLRKEFGREEPGLAKTSTPNSTALLPDGTLLAADSGQETLTHFAVVQGALVLQHRTRVHPGEGPAQLTVSSNGKFAYTTGAVRGTVYRHRLVDGRPTESVALAPRSATVLQSAHVHVPNAISLLLA